MARRILIVDDEREVAGTIADVLAWDGHDVACASSGIDALEQIDVRVPELVITDFMMPLLDGVGLIRELRNRPATMELPIVVMTAAPTGLQGADYDVLLPKPFNVQTLRSAIERAFERRAR